MIVKNAEEVLRPCLESVSGLVDQIVIADTGSTDRTCEIAREFGAVVLCSPWTDHFADARNASLAAVTTDWVLVLDGDEELSVEARAHLPSLLMSDDVGGYVVRIREYLPAHMHTVWPIDILPNDTGIQRASGSPVYMMNQLCRLFRRRSDIYFSGRVHELVQPQIERAGLQMAEASFFIDHFGHLTTQPARDGKSDFYKDLLERRLEEEPDNPMVWTYNGMAALDIQKKPLEALRLLEKALRLDPNLLEAWIVSAKALCALERWEDVLTVLVTVRSGKRMGYTESTLRGNACFALGRLEDAHAAYTEALSYHPSDQIAQAKLSYLEMRMNTESGATERLQRAAGELPHLVHTLLVDAHLQAGRIVEATEECERWCLENKVEGAFLQAAQLRAQQQNWERVEQLVTACLEVAPASLLAHELLLMAGVALGNFELAAAAAEALTELQPEPRAFLRAAAVHSRCGDKVRALEVLARGAALFPQALELQNALGDVTLRRGQAAGSTLRTIGDPHRQQLVSM